MDSEEALVRIRSTSALRADGIEGVSERLHDDEIPVDLGLVRRLIHHQLPQYVSLPIAPLSASGSSNALFRLGDELLVRLPRQPGGSASIEKEARWLPQVGPRLPTAVPEIVAIGDPGFGYPERWSVVRWIDGDTATVPEPGVQADPPLGGLVSDLAAAIRALREVDVPADTQVDPELRWYRGEPLAARDGDTRRHIEECRAIPGLELDLDAALEVWAQAMALPGSARVVTPRWYHGDLLTENLLVRRGRLAAVLDFGGLAVGDPTVDLIVAWEVLDAASRDVFRRVVGVDDETWLRGRAWALSLAVMTFPYYWSTMPQRCANHVAVVRSILIDAGIVDEGPHPPAPVRPRS